MSCSCGHLGFPIGIKNTHLVEDLPMIIPGQFGFNYPSSFREEAFWNIFSIGSNVKLSPAVAIGRSSTKFLFFYADRKFKMAATAGHRLTLDPMGKCSNAFFSETTNMIKAKLYMNVHWMDPMNIHVQFGFNYICSFWEEGICTFSHRVQC
jgi:hypothetical protein